jgi:SAM-dependent methyltransferase
MSVSENYGIRSDYVARQVAETRESFPKDYWHGERIRNVGQYQYAVYRAAASLINNFPKGSREVADVGCGYPVKAHRMLSPLVDSLSLYDQSTLRPVIEKDFPSMQFTGIDLEDPGTTNDAYDLTICSDVLEHLLDPDPCLLFLKRITKPGGFIVISTPERAVLRGGDCLISPKLEHVREWTRGEFKSYLESRGLDIREHVLVPEKRLNVLENMFAPLLGRIAPRRRWIGCQLVVCSSSQ